MPVVQNQTRRCYLCKIRSPNFPRNDPREFPLCLSDHVIQQRAGDSSATEVLYKGDFTVIMFGHWHPNPG